ncbi:UxaA family hydrolase [Acuticoccus sp.]|uniref:UxaA family hydrolase n=1 Tax=Acuticoccus sp. TaxID=1904378 RepID=UPI003B52A70D
MSALAGFVRADGRVGVRDHVLVLSTVALTNRWAHLAADGTGALVIAGEALRGLRGGDAAAQDALMTALVQHPNVGAALVLTQDAAAARMLGGALGDAGKPVAVAALLDQDGMGNAVSHARCLLGELADARSAKREDVGLGALTLALECGGSDPTSALASNAAIGRFVDRVIDAGGSAIASETVEVIGAEPAVDGRTPDPAVRRAIAAHIAARERWHAEDGVDYRGVNPTAENIEGGLTTLVEKSMGAVAKTGSRPFVGALAFAEAPTTPGLHFMDTPFFTPLSFTGMVAAGANLALFGLGQFNPSASPLAPTVKVCGNAQTVARWPDAIDVDASPVIGGDATLEAIADLIEARVVAIANGVPSAAERWGEGQFIMPRNNAPL